MMSAIEQAYVGASAGQIELPPVGHIAFPAVDGDCHIKFGHRHGDSNFVIKVATGFPQQAAIGAPTGNGLSLVLSAETGSVRAILHDQMLLTDIRTGISGAIATRLLARADARRLLIVGTGVQARRQIEAHTSLLDRELEIQVWGRSSDAADQVVDDIEPEVNASVARDLPQACSESDIIVTTTAAKTPIIDARSVRPGTHITAVGADAPGKHELDPQLLRGAAVLAADSRSQCIHHGELSAISTKGVLTSVVEIGELLAGHPGRQTAADITVADLTGIAALDIAVAEHVLRTIETNRLSER